MTAFWSGFWTWATEHWFLGFLILIAGLSTVSTVLKAFLRVFQRPQHKLTVNMHAPDPSVDEDEEEDEEEEGRQSQVRVPSTEAIERSLQDIVAQTVNSPPRPVRRTVWDRIRANTDKDDL